MTKQLVGSVRVGVLAVAATFCSQSHAIITFDIGNHPQSDEENILLNSGATGTSVTGATQQSNLGVLFESTSDTLSEPSSGQARVEALNELLNNITVSVPGGSFSDLIINPFVGANSGGGGTANITVLANEPDGSTLPFTFSYDLGNGQNFLTILATDGETIANVTIDADGGFTDLRQPRISGAALNNTPDGGSTLALLGSAIGTLGLARKRLRRS